MTDGLYTFEDIPLWSRVHLHGREGWVTDMGSHVSSKTEGRHLEVEFLDTEEKGNTRVAIIKESLVNTYLKEKRELWVDWDDRLAAYVDGGESCQLKSQQ